MKNTIKIRWPYKTIERFVQEKVGDYKIHSNGEIAINSPFVSDTTYDCHINVEKGCWHDWESDEGGNIEELVCKICGVDVDEARRILLKLSNGSLKLKEQKKQEPDIIETKSIEMPSNVRQFDRGSGDSLANKKAALNFLTKKLVDYELAKKYDLRWTEYSTLSYGSRVLQMSYRIIIPSYEDGALVYFQGRDYTDKSTLRYKNPPKEIQQKNIIVPFYDLIMPNEILFISEGPWEAIQYSGTYMLGPGLSDRQIYKIKKKNPKAIYIVPDNDETARSEEHTV